MIRFKDWKHSLHTWSTACCLRRDCSRVDRVWFRERWSDCIAAAAEASTWLFSSSPSSWRTTSDSCAVFKSVSTSCGNTLHKGVKTLYSADVTLLWFKGGMKWPNSITIWKTCVYYCISMPKCPSNTLYEKEMTARIKKNNVPVHRGTERRDCSATFEQVWVTDEAKLTEKKHWIHWNAGPKQWQPSTANWVGWFRCYWTSPFFLLRITRRHEKITSVKGLT